MPPAGGCAGKAAESITALAATAILAWAVIAAKAIESSTIDNPIDVMRISEDA